MKKLIPPLFLLVSSCHLINFPPVGPGGFPYPISQQGKFDLLLDSLNQISATDIDRVNCIRDYVARKIDLGESLDSLNRQYSWQSWAQTSPFTCLDGFDNNTLTAACGFSSMILCRLYAYAGFESYRYDCGYNNWDGYPAPAHRLVLVNVGGSLIIQDPFYNMTITDASGNAKDAISLLSEIAAGDFSNVAVNDAAVISDFWITDIAQYYALQAQGLDTFGQVLAVDSSGTRVRLTWQHDYAGLSAAAARLTVPLLVADGLPANYLSILLKPVAVRDDTGVVNDSLMQLLY